MEFIVLFYNREFDLPWEVDASKGHARSSRPGRSRWFSEDPFPPPLLQHCQYCVHGSTVCLGVTVQLVLYCRWCTVFFLYNYLFSEFPVSLELPLYKLLKVSVIHVQVNVLMLFIFIVISGMPLFIQVKYIYCETVYCC